MSDRAAAIAAFLDRSGWGAARRGFLAGDASFRRYDRLEGQGGARAVLMDAPPPQEDVRPFAAIARHLRGLGLSAPEILAEDPAAGLLLIEDLGDGLMARLLADGADPEPLYTLAVDGLAALHDHGPAALPGAGVPPYDLEPLLREACLLTDWFLPAALGRPTAPAVRADYVDAWKAVLGPALAGPPTLVLRDFFPDNLMVLPDRPGVASLGLLDFQDALAGHPAYDLVSLLEDARRDVPEALAGAMIERYLAARPGTDRAAFLAAYRVLGAQRHAKVIGIFTRLWKRDGKPGYMRHMARLWRLLERAAADPALAPLARWLDHHIPSRNRAAPPGAESRKAQAPCTP
ncbi:MAG: phosphotransferase [Rhodobacterales bacterium]|nr:phosphotransferase [Rhodobacterales bacterium]